jgi:hypothetical protein
VPVRRVELRLVSDDYVVYKATVMPLHYTGELAPGAPFERAHSLLNRQMPCHLATPGILMGPGGIEPPHIQVKSPGAVPS